MRLGLMLGYAAGRIEPPLDLVREAEDLGYHAVWTAEAYGSDAVTPLAWLGALTQSIHLGTGIMQMAARSPANTAMTAMTLNQLSGGRFLLGLGLSGPQVVEGWHGAPSTRPLARTREYVDIVRAVFARRAPLRYDGELYQIPYRGPGATGLGKALKSTLQAAAIPIYLAAIGPQNVALAAEIADGWLPIFFAPAQYEAVFAPHVQKGLARRPALPGERPFDIAPMVPVAIGDDLQACYDALRPLLALYIGGMGARDKNFYATLAARYGFEGAARQIQELYLSGQRAEAVSRVPAALIDEVALVGPRERLRERLAIWRSSPVRTLNLMTQDVAALRALAELLS